MNKKFLNVVFVWAIIFVWVFLRGGKMSPPGYMAITAATAITGYLLYSAFKGKR